MYTKGSALTPDETVIVSQVFVQASLQGGRGSKGSDADHLAREDAESVFAGAKLSAETLKSTFDVVAAVVAEGSPNSKRGRDSKQTFNRKQVGQIVRLVGWAQAGVEPAEDLFVRCVFLRRLIF
jgi:hypothetical protein